MPYVDEKLTKEITQLGGTDFICKPDSQSIVKKINDLDKDYDSKRMLALDYGKKYKIQFDKISIAKNILNIFNSNKKIKS